MGIPDKLIYADELLSRGETDEETERLAGVSLLEVLGLRAAQASAPARWFGHDGWASAAAPTP